MAIDKYSKHIRVSFDDDQVEIKRKFKLLAALADMPMSRRVVELIKIDVAYWEKHGKPMPLGEEDLSLSNKESNGHQDSQQQVKIIKPRKHHKAYKGQIGELLGELSGNQVKVSFDGEEKTFYSDEIEMVETE